MLQKVTPNALQGALFAYLPVGKVNDHVLHVITAQNRTLEFHTHADSDEVFFVLEGAMQIELEDGFVPLNTGDLLVIPAGTRHRPVCTEPVRCLLLEKQGTLTQENTGGSYTPPGN